MTRNKRILKNNPINYVNSLSCTGNENFKSGFTCNIQKWNKNNIKNKINRNHFKVVDMKILKATLKYQIHILKSSREILVPTERSKEIIT